MELMTGRSHKGLDLPLLSQGTMVAFARIEGGGCTRQFITGLSVNFIRSTSNISYEFDHSIRFLPVFDFTGLTRSPPGLRKIFLSNFNGMS